MTTASFGDNVRIVDAPITREGGFADAIGVVYGVTTPSVTGITFIGETDTDTALNVHFASRNEAFWFAPELVEMIDHGAGTEITLNGVNKKWVRRQDGGWDELPLAPIRHPWWKFWSS
jgi:hypothetical protein